MNYYLTEIIIAPRINEMAAFISETYSVDVALEHRNGVKRRENNCQFADRKTRQIPVKNKETEYHVS